MERFRFRWMYGGMLMALWLAAGQLKAQDAERLPVQAGWNSAPPTFLKTNPLFPQHVIRNPMGYSPLCRMELKIEDKSPVGVWMRLDGNRVGTSASPGWAYLRLKLPLGSR